MYYKIAEIFDMPPMNDFGLEVGLAVIYLKKSIDLDPSQKEDATKDEDFSQCRDVDEFIKLTSSS